jgi:hypothetical protein
LTPGRPAGGGAGSGPGSLVCLKDGRLVLTYVDRHQRRACAKISSDCGGSWGDEIVLQSGAGNWDIGYPRAVELSGGRLLSAYYWNDAPDRERYISGTIWKP